MPLGIISLEDLERELSSIDKAVVDKGVHKKVVEEIRDKEEKEDELNKNPSAIESHALIKRMHSTGGGRTTVNGNNSVPDGLRKLIAAEKLENGTETSELADVFGVSRNSVLAYTNGVKSVGKRGREEKYRDEGLELFVKETRGRIRDKASARLISALDAITEGKLVDAKPDILANVARAMSGIVKDSIPVERNDGNGDGSKSGVTIQFFSPGIKNEESYEVIDLQQIEA